MTLDQLIQWDQHATLWLNNLGNTTWDPFWLMLSDVKFWYPAYVILAVFLFKELGWKKGLAVLLSCILMVVCVDQSCNAVKDSVERLRPCYNSWMIAHGIRLPYGITGHLFGFFSGHAANTFGLANLGRAGSRQPHHHGCPFPGRHCGGSMLWHGGGVSHRLPHALPDCQSEAITFSIRVLREPFTSTTQSCSGFSCR